jgi:hypothetical protein
MLLGLNHTRVVRAQTLEAFRPMLASTARAC